jgi:peptide/nickel transport system permease protein
MTVKYIVKRVVLLILVLWTAATVNFFVPKLSPRNPILERLQQAAVGGGRNQTGLQEMLKGYEKDFGLDKPIWEQYLLYLGGAMRLDFGYSISQYPRKVTDVIMEAMPWTIWLATISTLIAFVVGSLLGALVAWPGAPRFLRWLMPPMMMLQSMPFFLLGLVLIYFLSFRWKIFPLGGGYSRGAVPQWTAGFALDLLSHAILPALSIILVSIGGWALGMRSLMVSTQGEDYITYAEAKGLKPGRIFTRYAMRNALLPQITGLLPALGFIIIGTGFVEVIFAYPGLGSLMGTAIGTLDYFLIYGISMILTIIVCIATLVIDIAYPLLDPRIKYERS